MRPTGLWELIPKLYVHIIKQILKPVTNTEILAPDLIGDQREMVV